MATSENISIPWYRTPLPRDVLRSLNARNDRRGLLQAGGHLCLVLLTGSLSIYTGYQGQWLLFAICLLLHGTVCAFLANACHELVHGTVFDSKRLNSFFLYSFAFVRWFPPEYYWRIHTAHHQYTLHPPADCDPELFAHDESDRLVTPTVGNLLVKGICNPLNMVGTLHRNLQHARGILGADEEERLFPGVQSRARVFGWARLLLGGHLTLALVALASGYWMVPVVVSLTPAYGSLLQLLCNWPQHAGLQLHSPDFRLNCRTHYLSPPLQFLYWHMNFHTEHHMYAAVPCYNLPELHALIAGDLPPAQPGLAAVWREILCIQRRQRIDPGYCFEQPLPPGAGP
jgi:fatty acid desaturase